MAELLDGLETIQRYRTGSVSARVRKLDEQIATAEARICSSEYAATEVAMLNKMKEVHTKGTTVAE